ncbi:MAG: hypothetical protein RL380_156 [Verrucomicrobiota bacterium]|jgi:hypothetical protein
MKLPNAENAIVAREKIEDYLLNAAHPDNGGKANFFETFGFQRSAWLILATALQTFARTTDVMQHFKSPHGQKFILVGRLETPSGKRPWLQTIWIVDNGSDVARLVSAYPHED